jgi:hypothetical protein
MSDVLAINTQIFDSIMKQVEPYNDSDMIVVFLIQVGKYIKFGQSRYANSRKWDYRCEMPGSYILFMRDTPHYLKVMKLFRQNMRRSGNLTEVIINDKKQTDMLQNITGIEAENILLSICEECKLPDSGTESVSLKKLAINAEIIKSNNETTKSNNETQMRLSDNKFKENLLHAIVNNQLDKSIIMLLLSKSPLSATSD